MTAKNIVDAGPVWRETAGRHADPTGVLAHAVDGEGTLCGLPATTAPWRDTGRGARCQECSTVLTEFPVTHAEIVAVGLSYRRLDYWSRRGWLKPANPDCGSGSSRVWPAGEVVVAQVMHLLVSAGVAPGAAARAARNGGVLAAGVRVVLDVDGIQLGTDSVGELP